MEAYGTTYDERAHVVIHDKGNVEVQIGTKSGGQSHETTYAQIVAQVLEIDLAKIAVVQGDSRRVSSGNGTGASRSMTTGGSALLLATQAVLEAARGQASTLLQCVEENLAFEGGFFRVGGAGAQVSLGDIAASLPGRRLFAERVFKPEMSTFPHGCNIADVEVDPETGLVEILSYVAVHDAGHVVNSQVVEGQIHGALTQGIGAALMECATFDIDTGQLLTASFLDYALPRADDLPMFDVSLRGIPCPSNPLGAKPVGEAGTVSAPPAVINAIIDALRPLGVEHLDLPATPQRIWSAIQAVASNPSRVLPNGA